MMIGTLIGGWHSSRPDRRSKSFDTVVGATVLVVWPRAHPAAYVASSRGVGSVATCLCRCWPLKCQLFSALAANRRSVRHPGAVFSSRATTRPCSARGHHGHLQLDRTAVLFLSHSLCLEHDHMRSPRVGEIEAGLDHPGRVAGGARRGLRSLSTARRALSEARQRCDIWGNLKAVASTPSKLILLVGAPRQELAIAMPLGVASGIRRHLRCDADRRFTRLDHWRRRRLRAGWGGGAGMISADGGGVPSPTPPRVFISGSSAPTTRLGWSPDVDATTEYLSLPRAARRLRSPGVRRQLPSTRRRSVRPRWSPHSDREGTMLVEHALLAR